MDEHRARTRLPHGVDLGVRLSFEQPGHYLGADHGEIRPVEEDPAREPVAAIFRLEDHLARVLRGEAALDVGSDDLSYCQIRPRLKPGHGPSKVVRTDRKRGRAECSVSSLKR
jgi:hypothetical protein